MKKAIKAMTLFVLEPLYRRKPPTAKLTKSAQNGKAKINPAVGPVRVVMPPWPLNKGSPIAVSKMTTNILRKALRGVRNKPAIATASVCKVKGRNEPPSLIVRALITINKAANKAMKTSERMLLVCIFDLHF